MHELVCVCVCVYMLVVESFATFLVNRGKLTSHKGIGATYSAQWYA